MYTSVKTIFPQIIDSLTINNSRDLNRFITLLPVLSSFTAEITAIANYNNAQTQCDSLSANSTFFQQISTSKYDVEFVDLFVSKLQTLPNFYRNTIKQRLSDLTIFEKQSDTIGLIDNVYGVLNDTVLPFNDITCTIYPVPKILPVNLLTKVPIQTQNLCEIINQTTTTLFRNSIINIQGVFALSDESHGSNLITDFNVFQNRRNNTQTLTQTLSAYYGVDFPIVLYNNTLNDNIGYNAGDYSKNLQVVTSMSYTQSIEGISGIQVDLLGKPLKSVRSNLTIKEFLGSYLTTIQQQKMVANTIMVPLSAKSQSTTIALQPVATQKASIQKTQSTISQANISPKSITQITSSVPEFSRAPYANAGNSPYSSVNGLKNLVCKLFDTHFSLGGLGGISIPKLPSFFSNFSFKLSGNLLIGLLVKTEQSLVKKLEGLIPALPNIEGMFVKLTGSITAFLKSIFTCNQDKL